MKLDLRRITEELIPVFDTAGLESINLYKKGLKIENRWRKKCCVRKKSSCFYSGLFALAPIIVQVKLPPNGIA